MLQRNLNRCMDLYLLEDGASLQWVQGQPERQGIPRCGWGQDHLTSIHVPLFLPAAHCLFRVSLSRRYSFTKLSHKERSHSAPGLALAHAGAHVAAWRDRPGASPSLYVVLSPNPSNHPGWRIRLCVSQLTCGGSVDRVLPGGARKLVTSGTFDGEGRITQSPFWNKRSLRVSLIYVVPLFAYRTTFSANAHACTLTSLSSITTLQRYLNCGYQLPTLSVKLRTGLREGAMNWILRPLSRGLCRLSVLG